VIGGAIGFIVPWFGLLVIRPDDVQRLATWSVAVTLPAAAVVDVCLFIGGGIFAWRKWSKRT
jgi:hypothetical protein